MRRYGDISIQYRYGGSRYASWPSAIYRDTTLTFIKRGSHYVVSTFSYLFKKYNLCRRCWLICLLKWTFKWTILYLIIVEKDGQQLQYRKTFFIMFKLSQSSQIFYCLVIFYFVISSQIPRISNLTIYVVYYLLYCHLYCLE